MDTSLQNFDKLLAEEIEGLREIRDSDYVIKCLMGLASTLFADIPEDRREVHIRHTGPQWVPRYPW